MSNVFALGYETAHLKPRAEILAAQLGLVLDNTHLPQLCVTTDKLVLKTATFSPLYVDLLDPKLIRRAKWRSQEGLLKAVGVRPLMRVLDATAGWGRDAALLSHAGAEVTLLEQNSLMYALLEDGVRRASGVLNLNLIQTEAIFYLDALLPEAYPDVIYLDPMHPARQKTALVKKELQILQQMETPCASLVALLTVALTRTIDKVVLKWPAKCEAPLKPTYSITGKTIRFDVYKR
jgi:16S rRNA (guanine1516-N2)-methyltransferase